jgi:hypothetical protein
LGFGLESDSDESSTQRAKDSRSSEHDFSALDATILYTIIQSCQMICFKSARSDVKIRKNPPETINQIRQKSPRN